MAVAKGADRLCSVFSRVQRLTREEPEQQRFQARTVEPLLKGTRKVMYPDIYNSQIAYVCVSLVCGYCPIISVITNQLLVDIV